MGSRMNTMHNFQGSGSSEKSDAVNIHNPIDAGQGQPNVSRVYVWDLDETLIIFQTLSNRRFADLFKGLKDPFYCVKLGLAWETLILQICDDCFFYEQVEDHNEPNVESLRNYDDGADLSSYDFFSDDLVDVYDDLRKCRLAYRHRQIGNLYRQGLEKLISEEQLQEWMKLYQDTDSYTDGWLTAGRLLLENCSKVQHADSPVVREAELGEPIVQVSDHIHVIVTSGSLIPSLVKCLLFRLDKFVACENIYSSQQVGKLQCFEWIRARFNHLGVEFCVIGDGMEECDAACALGWPFIKVETKPDGLHRLPMLSLPIIERYISVVYGKK